MRRKNILMFLLAAVVAGTLASTTSSWAWWASVHKSACIDIGGNSYTCPLVIQSDRMHTAATYAEVWGKLLTASRCNQPSTGTNYCGAISSIGSTETYVNIPATSSLWTNAGGWDFPFISVVLNTGGKFNGYYWGTTL